MFYAINTIISTMKVFCLPVKQGKKDSGWYLPRENLFYLTGPDVSTVMAKFGLSICAYAYFEVNNCNRIIFLCSHRRKQIHPNHLLVMLADDVYDYYDRADVQKWVQEMVSQWPKQGYQLPLAGVSIHLCRRFRKADLVGTLLDELVRPSWYGRFCVPRRKILTAIQLFGAHADVGADESTAEPYAIVPRDTTPLLLTRGSEHAHTMKSVTLEAFMNILQQRMTALWPLIPIKQYYEKRKQKVFEKMK